MKRHLIILFKWAWIAAVFIFIAFFIHNNYYELKESLKQIHIYYICLSFLCIFIAKILLTIFMHCVIQSIGQKMSLASCFRVYNISQLGKYLPGNIWHFVGKAAAYKNRGFTATNIKEALIVENVWLVFSAFAFGLVVIIIFEFDLLRDLISAHQNYFLVLIIIAPLTVLLASKLLRIDFRQIVSNYRLSTKITIIQFFIWIFLGLGFGVLIIPFISENTSLFMVTGLYAMAYSIGFVTPFAPAGIGIREGILALGLLPHIPVEVVLLVSAANRLVYLMVELVLAAVSQVGRHIKAKPELCDFNGEH